MARHRASGLHLSYRAVDGRRASSLRESRQQRGLTVDQLAAASGIDSSNVRSFENGRAMMSVKTLLRLAETLDVEPGELLANITSAMFEAEPDS